MAALSGAAAYSSNASMVSTATAYSAATGDQNAQYGLNVTMAAGLPEDVVPEIHGEFVPDFWAKLRTPSTVKAEHRGKRR